MSELSLRQQYARQVSTLVFERCRAKNEISVFNNGKGIPVTMHKEHNVYIPTLIFGHLLTSTNYSDDDKKVVGGRNGYGAKLCNLFSTKFSIETACKAGKGFPAKIFRQVYHVTLNFTIH